MLRYFFDCEGDYRHLFEGLAVAQDEEMMAQQGKYPVIALSFKDEKAANYDAAISSMAQLLYDEWLRHECLKGTPEYDELLIDMKASLRSGEIREALFLGGIKKLSDLLSRYFGTPVAILIDEYDSPLQNAWLNGYYDDMVTFMRPLLGSALKDNTALFKGVLTGILRVAKESLFSGLNNFVSDAGLSPSRCSDKFGFTEAEVAAMLDHYGLNGREMDAIRDWYDGYRYGGIPIYNPWSIISYVDDGAPEPGPYWVNTGNDALLRRLFFGKRADIKPKLEALMLETALQAPVDEHLVFGSMEHDPAAVLSVLYFAGYLRAENREIGSYAILFDLFVPNKEVLWTYRRTVAEWLREDLADTFHDPLLEPLLAGNAPAFGQALADFVMRVFSYYDAAKNQAEHFYHAFLLGLIARLDGQYRIRSNGESGYGRYDICLTPKDQAKKGIVMEIKAPGPGRNETLEDCIAAARAQILAKKYDTELAAAGVTDVLRLAIAVDGKNVIVEEA